MLFCSLESSKKVIKASVTGVGTDLCVLHIMEGLFCALVNAVLTLVSHKDEATTLLSHFVCHQGNLLNL